MIDTTPLQLYSSAIIFAPETSIVRHMFKDRIPEWICRLPKMHLTWSPELQKLEGHTGPVNAVAFSHDGRLLASASLDETIRLWNPATGEELQKLEGHTNWVTAVAFSHNGQLLASASWDKTVRLWNPATGEELQKLKGHTGPVNAVAFSHDGQLLASVSRDKMVRLWNPATGEGLQKLKGHTSLANAIVLYTGLVNSVVFSHDGQLLALASRDKTVRLWNPATGDELQKLKGHTSLVNAVAFSHDSQLLASASWDKTVRLWNPATGEELQKFEVNVAVEMISFSTKGPFLETNRGLLKAECYRPPASLSQTDPITKIFVKKHWFTRDLENLLWLPPEYRPTCSAFQNNVFALGCSSGIPTFVEFR